MYRKIIFPLLFLVIIVAVGFYLVDGEDHTIPFVVIQTGGDILPVPDIPAGAGIYPLTAQSYVSWSGYTSDGGYLAGKFKPDSGTLTIRDMDVIGGFTSIDMTSLSLDQDSPTWREGADDYLSNIFFAAEEYPRAEFVHKAHTGENFVIGDLTLLGTTHQVMFPMNFFFTGDTLVGDAYFVIERSQRGLTGLADFLDADLGISLHFVWQKIGK